MNKREIRFRRAAYPQRQDPYWARFQPLVIGLYGRLAGMVDSPAHGVDHFIYFSYQPVLVPQDEEVLSLPAYALFVIPPEVPIRHGLEAGHWRRSWLRCRGSAVPELLRLCGIPVCTPLPLPGPELHEQHLLELDREMNHPRGADPEIAEDLFCVWLRDVRREARPARMPLIPERFRRAREFVEQHFLEPLTLERIAREIHLSRSQLCRGFRVHFRQSPIDYALHLRLQLAAELLDNVNLNISEVAVESGFRDVFYFSRCFKQHLGVSPSDYRRRRLAQ